MTAAEVITQAARPWAELSVAGSEDLARRFSLLRAVIADEAAALADDNALRAFRDRWLARKTGILTLIKDHWLASAPVDWKKPLGQGLNALREAVESAIAASSEQLRQAQLRARIESERVDLSLPGRPAAAAPAHPVLRTMQEMVGIFLQLGYTVADGPEMESAWYNFETLNIPEGHPARDEQDSLYLGPERSGLLLRTHTSPVQIRTMERQQPPVRVVVPGKVYRRDAPDATHSPMFHQVEGLAVDEHITFGDLKGTLDHFAREMFGTRVRTRFRPSYFPFTEPSAEMDISCIFCAGAGCRTCKQSGWIEVLGCGMVDPALYRFVNYDPEKYTGFAFGMGVERMAMLRYGVDDIQRFYSGDVRFLQQFRD